MSSISHGRSCGRISLFNQSVTTYHNPSQLQIVETNKVHVHIQFQQYHLLYTYIIMISE